jgi:hypothetical protein
MSAHQGGIAERKAMIDREHDLSRKVGRGWQFRLLKGRIRLLTRLKLISYVFIDSHNLHYGISEFEFASRSCCQKGRLSF